eukprot:scaffold48734_cov72-Phaeocystis_antarctica.AAC.7
MSSATAQPSLPSNSSPPACVVRNKGPCRTREAPAGSLHVHCALLVEVALADREVDSGARSLLQLPPAKQELQHLDADLRQLAAELAAELALDATDGVALGDHERDRLAPPSLHTQVGE